ncbi:MAG: hypothetical protein ACRDSR_26000 [Pseudonocardiaceae bacterium]
MAGGLSEYERWVRQQQREAEREQRAVAAAERAAERERRQQHIAACQAQVELLNRRLDERIADLESILRRSLTRSSRLDLRSLCRVDPPPPLDLGEHAHPLPQPDWEQFRPHEPGVLSGLFGGRNRYAKQMTDAEAAFAQAERERDAAENRRQACSVSSAPLTLHASAHTKPRLRPITSRLSRGKNAARRDIARAWSGT